MHLLVHWDVDICSHTQYFKPFVGNLRYCSIDAHLGVEQGRKCDLESLGYMLVYFLLGELPWQDLRCMGEIRPYVVLALKQRMTPDKLCGHVSDVLSDYIQYCLKLQFMDRPNYFFWHRQFGNALTSPISFDVCNHSEDLSAVGHPDDTSVASSIVCAAPHVIPEPVQMSRKLAPPVALDNV